MKKITALTLPLLFALNATAAPTEATPELLKRPPQYVLISFDGSFSHQFWKESLDLAAKTKSKFSYFISGVYFFKRSNKMIYTPPRHKVGASDIGFGNEETEDIQKRTEFVWSALEKGFDIGSHVNGHFDGGAWTKDEWTAEFAQFHKFVEKVFSINSDVKAPFSAQWETRLHNNMRGFRAPLLARNLATNQVLKDFNYLYDASQTTDFKWPSKLNNGVWNMALGRLPLAGTGHLTVAMDYNMFYGQCNGKFAKTTPQACEGLTPVREKYFENQVYLTYISAFLKSYYGNRAPLSIGHHFSLWNKGIYWKALQRAVYDICTQPEVKCVTHKEMVAQMETLVKENGSGVTALLNQAAFDKRGTPTAPHDKLKVDLSILQQVSDTDDTIPEIEAPAQRMMLKGDLPQAHDETQDTDMDQFRYVPSAGGGTN